MRRMITDKLTKNIKEVVKAYDDGEIALTEDIPTKTSDLTNDSGFITASDVTQVVANPTLAGDEANLTGLQVGDTKYAVPQGGGGSQLYAHNVCVVLYTDNTKETMAGMITATIINSNNTVINDVTKLGTALTSIQSAYRPLSANGSDGTHNVFGLVNDNGAAYEYFGSGSPQIVAISADTSWIGDEVVTL